MVETLSSKETNKTEETPQRVSTLGTRLLSQRKKKKS
jgi:hypothetical protein